MSALRMVPLSKLLFQRLRHEERWDDERKRMQRNWFQVQKGSHEENVQTQNQGRIRMLKRFKDGQVHFGDLVAGNYLFMHVNPTSFKCLERDNPFQKFHTAIIMLLNLIDLIAGGYYFGGKKGKHAHDKI
ncbi:hypothetical protein JHK82_052901 [Glycine max]|uniref:Uncharacterized protein n=2 Tax=Glycine subgen. Soja TaxID=1462606 RepID=A0A0R0EJK4_SOYBN|nr:hypothetical protein JHK86_052754 [Glycine max]KAG4927121.1 hypothetical protein JHK85_053607 [Glycine max]KAG5082742.1 hypothetical protein JHK84_052780 [Glycine max]KAG5085504.1 hypothetical protein JHK82_052901 [Glycine max]RZB46934.1 hypothetical protein D0Y65_050816 [Glycine soja]